MKFTTTIQFYKFSCVFLLQLQFCLFTRCDLKVRNQGLHRKQHYIDWNITWNSTNINCIIFYNYNEASRGARAQSVTVKSTGCGFDPHFALVSRQSAVLNSAAQHTTPPQLGGKWGTECLNTRFSLPTLLCAGYSVKLI